MPFAVAVDVAVVAVLVELPPVVFVSCAAGAGAT
jgi:hypothetical protein